MAEPRADLESLLDPSLEGSVRSDPIYSVQACFFVAFLGGPFAIIFFSGLNAHRLRRLARDAWALVLAALVTAFFIGLISLRDAGGEVPEWLSFLGDGRTGVRNFARLLALVLFGGFYLLHQRFHRASALRADEAPSPWVPGLVATLAGLGATTAVIAVAKGMGG